MKIGMVGLGRMGYNMTARLRDGGHEVVGYDVDPRNADVDSLEALRDALPAPRVVWVMVPAGEPTTATITHLAGVLEAGDLVVDGGNSRFSDDRPHATLLAARGIDYVDVGVSGGVWGRENGYAMMAGGSAAAIERLMPVFDTLRPEGPREESFVHAGPVGAGHYAKMVHNGIEYAIMQAYAEGYELLTTQTELIPNVPAVFQAWQRGTVVRSWLLELMVRALREDPELAAIEGYAPDSGEGRWTVEEAIRNAVPLHTIAASLFARFESRQEESRAMKAIAALRQQFGGHAVKSAVG